MSAKPKVLIITAPDSPELRVLEGIAGDIDIVAVGQNAQDLASLSDEDWASVTVLLNCGVHHRTQQIVQLCLCVCLMSLSDVHAIICVSCRARHPSCACASAHSTALGTGVGQKAGKKADIEVSSRWQHHCSLYWSECTQCHRVDVQAMWPRLTALEWMHSASAGLEHLLFPALVGSPVTLTNAKGVYSHSLAEYALTCCNWFAKDLPRMRAAQKRREWESFEVEELRGLVPPLFMTLSRPPHKYNALPRC